MSSNEPPFKDLTPKPIFAKPPKGQFRCFQCRKAFALKEGDWYRWSAMEVHLCQSCAKLTDQQPERQP